MKLAIDCRLIGQSGIGTYIENIVVHAVNQTDISFVLIGDRNRLSIFANKTNCRIIECTHHSFSLKELFCFPTKEVNQCEAFFTPNFNIPIGIKVPIFCTIHDVVFFDVEGICSRLGKAIRWIYIKRALSIAKMVFTVSNFSKNRIRTLFHFHADIPVIYNGISQELIQYRQTHYNIKKSDYIACLGNLKKYKGVRELISAYQIAQANGNIQYKLLIIGRIDFRSRDEDIIRLLNNKNSQIEFITDADNTRVYELLAGAKALVSPSNYEGFGIPPLEAMYLHTPAIISDIPPHQEIYKDTPAHFFKAGNIDDLSNRLRQLPTETCNIDQIVYEKYNYQRAALKILDIIKTQLK